MARLLGASMLVVAASAVASTRDGPACCDKCELPLIKYYSVDLAHGFCGNACMDPKKFSIYKKFEANLTLVDDENPDCSGQYTADGTFYTDYDSTVTHGDPFGILAVTLDLYAPKGMPDHSCCSTPLPLRVNCGGKPKSMTIRGTGPYCCPASSTEEEPCKKEKECTPLGQRCRGGDECCSKMCMGTPTGPPYTICSEDDKPTVSEGPHGDIHRLYEEKGCPKDCSGHGKCSRDGSFLCFCDAGWSGEDCAHQDGQACKGDPDCPMVWPNIKQYCDLADGSCKDVSKRMWKCANKGFGACTPDATGTLSEFECLDICHLAGAEAQGKLAEVLV